MSVRRINKVKRELRIVLIALNIRKIVTQRAKNNQITNEKGNFYIISIEIAFFNTCSRSLCLRGIFNRKYLRTKIN
ncbi:hypothetical protein [Staphylococcus caprae]|uniref:hypothetical protein n=1 Tax=Staphylococcus caprae TaxID=29380 RepID=UPI003B00EA9A